VQWVLGYEFDRSKERRQGGAAALGERTSTTRNEDNQADNSDLFVQASTPLSEQWSALAGVRYSSVRFASQDHFLSDGDGSGAVRYQAGNPVLGLTYQASDRLNLYANYGKGFESPTLVEVAYSGGGKPAFNTSLAASRSRHYELGLKWAPAAQSRLDFTLYQIEARDEIVVASSTGGSATFKNAPGTRRTGWELSGASQFTPHWRATLAASQIDAKFSQSFTSNGNTVQAGKQIPGIPQSLLFSELLWTSQGNSAGASSRTRLGSQAGLELTRAGRLYANDSNSASAEGYATLNLKVSHAWALGGGTLTAYARIDNLTDKRYVGSVIVNQAASQFYEPAPGRNATLGLRLVLPL
jgi:iron complex outermembrane receptor protein